ncbi:MAG: hypothetical protein OHK005_12040 [Candidatus Methylacidiphilales bacterium]
MLAKVAEIWLADGMHARPVELTWRDRSWLVVLFAVWLVPGLFGRDPWKADEAYSFGLVWHMVTTGDYLVPTLGGEPFMEKPPLLYPVAAFFVQTMSWLFAPHEAARLAVIFFHTLTFLLVAWTARKLNGPGKGWVAPVVLIGAPGLLHTGHLLVTDVALLTTFALALAGWALSRERPVLGGLVVGAGAGLSFLAKGMIGPGVLGLTTLALLAFPAWRTRAYVWRTMPCALVAVLPAMILWPLGLYLRDPALFHEWLFDQNLARFSGAREKSYEHTYFFFFVTLAWYALPATPLALWTLWKEGWKGVTRREVSLPLTLLVVMLGVLTVSGQKREIYAMPMLAPLAVLAVRHIDLVPGWFRHGFRGLAWLGFSLLVAVAWLGWTAQVFGWPEGLAERFARAIPDYKLGFHAGLVGVALVGTVGWVLRLWWASDDSARTSAVTWAAGMATVYLLVMTLWLPATNFNMTFAHTFTELGEVVRERQVGEIGSEGLGEPQRGMLDYYAGLWTRRVEVDPEVYDKVNWFLIQGDYRPGRELLMGPPKVGQWELMWEGRRSGKESFRLYKKMPRAGDQEVLNEP